MGFAGMDGVRPLRSLFTVIDGERAKKDNPIVD